MTNVIYTYQLELTDTQTIEMKMGAEILTVQAQDGILCIWALVNPKLSNVKRTFEIIGTGNPFYITKFKYISTAQMNGFVWHIFEQI